MIGRLWRGWAARHWRAMLGALGFMALTAASVSLYPIAVERLIGLLETPVIAEVDGVAGSAGGAVEAGAPASPPRGQGQLMAFAPFLFVLTVVSGVSLYLSAVSTQRIGFLVIRQLQTDVFAHIMRADFADIAGTPPGQLISRLINDAEKVREVATRAATNVIRDGLTVVGTIAAMVWIDWLMTLLVLVFYPIAFQPVLAVGRRLRKRAARAQSQIGDLTAFLDEMFAGSRLIKSYGLEPYANRRADGVFEDRFALSLSVTRTRAAAEPILEVAGGAAMAGTVMFVAWRMGAGDFSVGSLVAFIVALAVLAPRARAIGTLMTAVQEGSAALTRIFAVLDYAPKIVSKLDAVPLQVTGGMVCFEDVAFAYPHGEPVLRGLSLTLEAGKTTALVGPSGAGKSTVMNLIPRLYDPDAGRVLIDGVDIAACDLSSVRAGVSVVSQDAILFDDTIAENIRFGRAGASDDEVRAAADAAAALDFILEQPDGFETRVGPRGGALSGGQRQRIALARAFLKDAPILLLDEATSALDAESEARVQAALETLSKGRTTLVIAHRLATVRAADMIYVLDAGAVVEQGRDGDLKDKADGLYAKLRTLQFASD